MNDSGKACMRSKVREKHDGERKTCYDIQNFLPPNPCLYPCDSESHKIHK